MRFAEVERVFPPPDDPWRNGKLVSARNEDRDSSTDWRLRAMEERRLQINCSLAGQPDNQIVAADVLPVRLFDRE